MTNAEIAEWCGWKHQPTAGVLVWYPPAGGIGDIEPPDYHHDLNACAEFERKIQQEWRLRLAYAGALDRLVRPLVEREHGRGDLEFYFATATPAQRCAALAVVVEEPRQ
jgi:hypothetical protein